MAKSAFRVLEIMEYVAQCNNGASHTEIAAALRIPKSSLTGLMRDLLGPGYLQLDEGTGRFSIGSQVMFLANAYLKRLNIVRDGAPFVHRIFVALNEFTSLAIPKGDYCVLVCAESAPAPLAHSLNIGERVPMLSSAAGKAILAFLGNAELDEYLASIKPVRHTPQTMTKTKDIREDLKQIRETGLAYGREEYLGGITGIASPIFNVHGRPIASISVALPTARLTEKLEKKIRTTLLAETAALSSRLGADSTKQPLAKDG
jgi:DNA-binding IclR family transcriptional regulator